VKVGRLPRSPDFEAISHPYHHTQAPRAAFVRTLAERAALAQGSAAGAPFENAMQPCRIEYARKEG
jgi:hypothetical protein